MILIFWYFVSLSNLFHGMPQKSRHDCDWQQVLRWFWFYYPRDRQYKGSLIGLSPNRCPCLNVSWWTRSLVSSSSRLSSPRLTLGPTFPSLAPNNVSVPAILRLSRLAHFPRVQYSPQSFSESFPPLSTVCPSSTCSADFSSALMFLCINSASPPTEKRSVSSRVRI